MVKQGRLCFVSPYLHLSPTGNGPDIHHLRRQNGPHCPSGFLLDEGFQATASSSGGSKSTPFSETNLRAHNEMHAKDPALFQYEAVAQVAGTAAAARSLGIHHDLIEREARGRASASQPMERYLRHKERPIGQVTVNDDKSSKKSNNRRT